jgi:hypothetical protein
MRKKPRKQNGKRSNDKEFFRIENRLQWHDFNEDFDF